MRTARSPIDSLFDKVDWRCTRCGAKQGTCACDCWTTITLRCPKCARTKQASNDETDPKGTAVVEVTCDKCDDGGGFPETHYYDAKGRWWDGKKFKRSAKRTPSMEKT